MSRMGMFEHSAWFRPYVAAYYAFQYGLPQEDRAWVEAHADQLIDVGQGRAQPGDVELMRYTTWATSTPAPI